MAVGKYLPEANPGPTEAVGATIKTLYEARGDTNAYTDAEKSKLTGIEEGATAGGEGMTQEQIDKLAGIATGADVTGSNAPQAHTIVSHDTDTTGAELTSLGDNSIADTLHRHSELSASDGSPDRIVYTNSEGVLFADALGTGASSGLGLDVMYGATIGTHLTVGNNITVVGTVDGVDIAARDHAESHNAASHSDIASTGANVDDAVSKKHTDAAAAQIATHKALASDHHAASHSVASHNDTTATGAELNTLTGSGETALHSHAGGGLLLLLALILETPLIVGKYR